MRKISSLTFVILVVSCTSYNDEDDKIVLDKFDYVSIEVESDDRSRSISIWQDGSESPQGKDNTFLTDDDGISGYMVHLREPETFKIVMNPGNDGIWFTDDDYIFSEYKEFKLSETMRVLSGFSTFDEKEYWLYLYETKHNEGGVEEITYYKNASYVDASSLSGLTAIEKVSKTYINNDKNHFEEYSMKLKDELWKVESYGVTKISGSTKTINYYYPGADEVYGNDDDVLSEIVVINGEEGQAGRTEQYWKFSDSRFYKTIQLREYFYYTNTKFRIVNKTCYGDYPDCDTHSMEDYSIVENNPTTNNPFRLVEYGSSGQDLEWYTGDDEVRRYEKLVNVELSYSRRYRGFRVVTTRQEVSNPGIDGVFKTKDDIGMNFTKIVQSIN